MIQGISSADLGYWGTIRNSVQGRATTTDVWNAIRAYQARFNLPSPTGGFTMVTKMRSIAAAQRNASEAFTAAGPETAMNARYIATDINARPLAEQQLAPLYNIRFEVTHLVDGVETTGWLTVVKRGALPATKGGVLDLIAAELPGLAIGSEMIVTGTTGATEIVAV